MVDKQADFEIARPRLMGLAYRMLGTVAEAEDAVQETAVRWLAMERGEIRSPLAWLTTVCTRYCLDQLKSVQRQRVDYVGPWLPEPLATTADEGETVQLASTLHTAFILMLERLSPKERAAYLLHDIFDVPYDDVSEVLQTSPVACRKLVSRARTHVGSANPRYTPNKEKQKKLLWAFLKATESGDLADLSQMLAGDVRLSADGGGKVMALQEILQGKERVESFIRDVLVQAWSGHVAEVCELNGAPSLVYRGASGSVDAVVSFDWREKGPIKHVYIVRNPDKMTAIETVTRLE